MLAVMTGVAVKSLLKEVHLSHSHVATWFNHMLIFTLVLASTKRLVHLLDHMLLSSLSCALNGCVIKLSLIIKALPGEFLPRVELLVFCILELFLAHMQVLDRAIQQQLRGPRCSTSGLGSCV